MCPRKNPRYYAGAVAEQGFNAKPKVQTCQLKAALPHIPHPIDQHKINTGPATTRAFVPSNTILILKQPGVLGEADGAHVGVVMALPLQRKALKKNNSKTAQEKGSLSGLCFHFTSADLMVQLFNSMG